METRFYNNLCINTGIGTASARSPVAASGLYNVGTIKIYNNTFYGGGDPNYGVDTAFFHIQTGGDDWSFGGSWELINNIIVDTLGTRWEMADPYPKHPTASSNNIWYSTYATKPKPSWEPISSVYTNPLLSYPSTYDFTLSSSSPAINAGADLSSIVGSDFGGILRPQGANFDIGAYEY